MTYHSLMRRCLELAQVAGARGEPPVAALISRRGTIVAEAAEAVRTKGDITAHAEVDVIRSACAELGTLDLSGIELVTTMEPCLMYSYAIREAGLATVVFGAPYESFGGISSRYPVLSLEMPGWAPAPKIVRDVLRTECEARHRT